MCGRQKNTFGGIQGVPIGNTGCPKTQKMKKFQIGQIGQVRYQITSTKSQDVKKIVLAGIQGVPIEIQGVS
jgi:hypothetical protein